MSRTIDGKLLGRRFLLVTGLIVASLVATAGIGMHKLWRQAEIAEIGLTMSHLGEGIARLTMAAHRAAETPTARNRQMLNSAFLAVLYHVDELRAADPLADRSALDAALPDMAARRLAGYVSQHRHGLGAVPMTPQMQTLWRGADGASGLEAEIGRILADIEHLAAQRGGPQASAAPIPPLPHLQTEELIRLLRQGSVIAAQDQERALWTAGAALLLGSGAGIIAALVSHLLVLLPLRRRILRDRATLAEALRRAQAGERAKSEFLSVMSHELRTPLNGVLGMAALLDESGLDRRQRGFVAAIRSSAMGLLDVIGDILVFNPPDLGKLRPIAEPFALKDLGAEPIARLAPAAALKGLSLVVRRPHGAPCCLRGDRERLDHVIQNLLGNAVKFTKTGEIRMTIAAHARAGATAKLHIEVEDTGCGVKPEMAERIFGMFEQADASATRSAGGVGLGLAVCATLMRQMGGRIGMRSGEEGGAVFWVELDLPVADCAERDLDLSAIAGLRAAFASPSAARLAAGGEILASLSVAYQTADGPDALAAVLAAAGDAPPDLLFIDHAPPLCDAEACLLRLRAQAETAALPVIQVRGPGAEAGPHPQDPLTQVLLKPATRETAAAAISAVMARAGAQRLLDDDMCQPAAEAVGGAAA